jgi:hypothetical protein
MKSAAFRSSDSEGEYSSLSLESEKGEKKRESKKKERKKEKRKSVWSVSFLLQLPK